MTFHTTMKPVVVAAQVLLLMPIYGVRKTNSKFLRFRWFSLRSLFSFIALGWSISLTAFSFGHLFSYKFVMERINTVIFYGSVLSCGLQMLQLTFRWPSFVSQWTQAELKFSSYQSSEKVRRKVKLITIFFLCCAFIEHEALDAMVIYDAIQRKANYNDDFLHSYAVTMFGHIFNQIEYNPYLTIIIKFFNTLMTAWWNFIDIMVITICVCLADMFEQLNLRIRIFRVKVVRITTWKQIREDYNILSMLTSSVNRHIRYLVLQSLCVNLYFVCYQLFNSLETNQSWIRNVYVYMSFLYLVLRICACMICASDVNEQSKMTKRLVCNVAPENYCEETERLIFQVSEGDEAITLCGWFCIKKSLLFKVFSLIVTYETLLIQLDIARR